MQVPHGLPYLREVLLFLALAGILIPLLQRLRINQILGFLALGVVVGPYGIGLLAPDHPWLRYFLFAEAEEVAPLAELGVLFLMFMVGLELSTERLWALRRWVFGAGMAQVLLSALALGALTYAYAHGLETSIVIGLMLALSSTAVAMQLMSQERILSTPLGQAAFSVLMLQDLAVVPILILVGALSEGAGAAGLPRLLLLALLKSVVAIVLIYLLGRRAVGPMFRAAARQHAPETFMALTLLASLGIGALTAAAGLSMALGAFLAGLLLAETEFRHEVEVTVEPFKGLLMGLFFMAVGLQIDVRQIMAEPGGIALAVLGLFLVKGLVLAVVLRAGGFNWGRAIQGGLLLGQGGEFAFVVAGLALAGGLLTPELGRFVTLVVGLSMFASTFLARLGRVFANRWEARHGEASGEEAAALPAPREQVVIIGGFGRVGQLLGQVLAEQGVHFIAFESDARLVARLNREGHPVYFGHAERPELLEKVHAGQARAIVLTMDHPGAALHAVRAIRSRYPGLPLYARARDEKHAGVLQDAGATMVIPETLEAGLQLSAAVLQELGTSEGRIARLIHDERERRVGGLERGARLTAAGTDSPQAIPDGGRPAPPAPSAAQCDRPPSRPL